MNARKLILQEKHKKPTTPRTTAFFFVHFILPVSQKYANSSTNGKYRFSDINDIENVNSGKTQVIIRAKKVFFRLSSIRREISHTGNREADISMQFIRDMTFTLIAALPMKYAGAMTNEYNTLSKPLFIPSITGPSPGKYFWQCSYNSTRHYMRPTLFGSLQTEN